MKRPLVFPTVIDGQKSKRPAANESVHAPADPLDEVFSCGYSPREGSILRKVWLLADRRRDVLPIIDQYLQGLLDEPAPEAEEVTS